MADSPVQAYRQRYEQVATALDVRLADLAPARTAQIRVRVATTRST